MATRGTLYRCHLFSFAGPQSEGVISRWGQGASYIGGSEVAVGETVSLYAQVERSALEGESITSVEFEILDQDFLLTGGLDDRIATITTGTAESDGETPVEKRALEPRTVELGAIEAELERLADEDTTGMPEVIAVLSDSADPDHGHILTRWKIPVLDDSDVELYFIVKVNDRLDDQTEETIRVPGDAATAPAPVSSGQSRVAEFLNWRPGSAYGR